VTRAKSHEEHAQLPLLPLKDVVVFPRMVLPLMVGRAASLAAVEQSLAKALPLFLCSQKNATVEHPDQGDLSGIGVAANIVQTLRMPDGTTKVVVEALRRGRIHRVRKSKGYLTADVSRIDLSPVQEMQARALMRTVLAQFEDYARSGQRVAPEIVNALRNVDEPEALADLICAYLALRVEERQELLEILDVTDLLERISAILMRENELSEMERNVRDRVRDQMERTQREYYLHEQLKAIHKELGHAEEGSEEGAELRALVAKARMPQELREKVEREITRYERMTPMSPEGSVIRGYIEWLAELPWQKRTRDVLDLDRAQKILDEDHYGLDKVKERILEFLAVRKLSKQTRGPILCLVGPPGVGKTSLGQSIARAMDRKFVRVSLGGVRDEAEIRGHRRTYIGSMPGRIVQSIRKVGVKNPVFMLDEIDKMSADFRGDPSSAMLEVLDPEQNHAFSDHYLEVDFDLREVFFIATANYEYDIPEPLHDRMEIVRLPGYTTFEKERIAKRFLVPKQQLASGLSEAHIRFATTGIDTIIQRYTREAGVRELERQLANVCRKVARRSVVGRPRARRTLISDKKVHELLGPAPYPELRAALEAQVGVAVGLAWTSVGGELLKIETITMKGKGDLVLTGQLGDVMKESAQAAYSYLRAQAQALGISSTFYKDLDMHLHVPEGAIPKDGPSAGVTIATSLLSALRQQAPTPSLAMTGEITLRGNVLVVGGLKEKVLAAHRAGIRRVLIPEENSKDLLDIPREVKREIEFIEVKNLDEVFAIAFKPAKKRAKAGR
jgi:ATP-dependent Lon protease